MQPKTKIKTNFIISQTNRLIPATSPPSNSQENTFENSQAKFYTSKMIKLPETVQSSYSSLERPSSHYSKTYEFKLLSSKQKKQNLEKEKILALNLSSFSVAEDESLSKEKAQLEDNPQNKTSQQRYAHQEQKVPTINDRSQIQQSSNKLNSLIESNKLSMTSNSSESNTSQLSRKHIISPKHYQDFQEPTKEQLIVKKEQYLNQLLKNKQIIQVLQKQLKAQQERSADKDKFIQEKETFIQALQRQIQSKIQQIHNLNNRLKYQSETQNKYKEKIQIKESQIERLTQICLQNQQEINNLNMLVKAFKQQSEREKKSYQKLEENIKESLLARVNLEKQKDQVIEMLLKQIQHHKQVEFQLTQKMIDNLSKDEQNKNKLKKQINEKSLWIKAMIQQKELIQRELQSQNQQMHKQNSLLKKQTEYLKNQNSILSDEILTLAETKSSLELLVREKDQESANSQLICEKIIKMIRFIEDQTLDDAWRQNQKLFECHEQLLHEKVTFLEEISSMQAHINKIQQQNNGLETHLLELTDQIIRLQIYNINEHLSKAFQEENQFSNQESLELKKEPYHQQSQEKSKGKSLKSQDVKMQKYENIESFYFQSNQDGQLMLTKIDSEKIIQPDNQSQQNYELIEMSQNIDLDDNCRNQNERDEQIGLKYCEYEAKSGQTEEQQQMVKKYEQEEGLQQQKGEEGLQQQKGEEGLQQQNGEEGLQQQNGEEGLQQQKEEGLENEEVVNRFVTYLMENMDNWIGIEDVNNDEDWQ